MHWQKVGSADETTLIQHGWKNATQGSGCRMTRPNNTSRPANPLDPDAEGESRTTALMKGNKKQAPVPISRFENSLDAAGVRRAQSDHGKLRHRTPSLHG